MTGPWLALILLFVLALPLVVAVRRSGQVFVLDVRAGQVRFVRGRIPQALFDQILDILRGSSASGSLIAVTDDGRPRLVARGDFNPGLLQQLRNVLGLYPLAKLRGGGRPRA